MESKFALHADLTAFNQTYATFGYAAYKDMIVTSVMSRELWERIGCPNRVSIRIESI